ncbi:thiamine pyrophosphate-binding protein [uncultured Microbacterium sp.]|uniref:thiamine pyrophosphate-binding protein n=1 Tax=uncultured Microbacterium sp. TaxID=191216 RepID=UPI0025F348D0|nr:thiamine pyrophosphate-binding protein [uncultured Microbacterium sp.]
MSAGRGAAASAAGYDAGSGAHAPEAGSAASEASVALLCELVRRGLTDIVLSPGSRSQALALTAEALERAGIVRLHVRIDERVAGFTALGIGREARVHGDPRPAAVICTSGTAVANLLPAVLEAHHAGVPLLLLTADRPPELRGVGANQTTRQPGIFGSAVRWATDAPVPEGFAGSPAAPAVRTTAEISADTPGGGADTPGGGENSRSYAQTDAESEASPAAETSIGADADAEADAERAAERETFREIAAQAWEASLGVGTHAPGPVHVNLPVREPLAGALSPEALADLASLAPDDALDLGIDRGDSELPDEQDEPDTGDADDEPDASATADSFGALYQGGGGIGEADVAPEIHPATHVLERGPRTIVVAGADAGPDAERLSWTGGWPLVAEIVSGSRFGRYLVHGYRALLRDPDLGGAVERVVVYGRPTLSREVTALLSRDDVEVIAVNGPGERINLNGQTATVPTVSVEPGPTDRGWLGAWMSASRAPESDLPAPDLDGLASTDPHTRRTALEGEIAVARRPIDRAGLVDAVWRATWPHDRLVFGSSRLVRVADELLAGKNVPVHANRGVAGIDGTIATATGIAIASQAGGRPGVTRVVLGDLALLHDVGAMLLPAAETEPRLQVICGNDGGGSIFDSLEVAQIADADALTRVQFTPQHVRLAELARAYGWEYHLATTRAALDQVLLAPAGGRTLIEVPLAR